MFIKLTFLFLVPLFPLQFLAYTFICGLLFDPLAGAQTTIDVVPCPDRIVKPPETDQTYDVVFATATIEYVVLQVPRQILVDPVIEAGEFGLEVYLLIDLHVDGPVPQLFTAFTHKKPDVNRLVAQTVIDVPVEIPDVPEGKVHT